MAFVLLAAVLVIIVMQKSSTQSASGSGPGGTGVGNPDAYPPSVVALAEAIAKAEGYYAGNTLPFRNNNPGDIFEGGKLAVYSDPDTGWNKLYDKLMYDLYLNRSDIYSPNFSIDQLAQIWTGGDNPMAWASIVAGQLGVSTSTRVGDTLGV